MRDGWTETTLEHLGAWHSGSTPKATRAEFYGGSIPFVTISDLNGSVISETERAITDAGFREIGRWAPAGAVFLSMYGSIGKVGMAARPMTTNQAIAWVECDPEVCDPRFILVWLSWKSEHFASQGRGATQRNINREIVKGTAIDLPPLADQRRIIEMVAAVDEAISAAASVADRGREARSALLADLLSGEHEIPEFYDRLLEGVS